MKMGKNGPACDMFLIKSLHISQMRASEKKAPAPLGAPGLGDWVAGLAAWRQML